jgi:hypothetical protein
MTSANHSFIGERRLGLAGIGSMRRGIGLEGLENEAERCNAAIHGPFHVD